MELRTVTTAPEDRRDALRQETPEWSMSVRADGAEAYIGTIKDVSRTGIRFVTSASFPCGSEVEVAPPESSGLPPIRMLLVRQRMMSYKDAASGFEYGARFLEGAGDARHQWYLKLRRAA
jgi:hypothetical protein